MNEITIKAPCKVNLSLDITGKRSDGYHTLESVFQTVSLFDEVYIKKTSDDIILHCDNLDIDIKSNTCYKAVVLFFEKTEIKGGAEISVRKHIPSQAGLGGGSSDAAAVLKGLNAIYETNLTDDELCEIGVKIGADVPFFIIGNTAYVSGIGEIIKPIKPICNVFFVIAKGKNGVSTVKAYKEFDKLNSPKHTDTNRIVEFIENCDIISAAKLCVNSLEDCARIDDISTIKSILDKNGAELSLMSGSGSAVFGLFLSRENAEIARLECAKLYDFTAICEPYTEDNFRIIHK